MALEFIDRTIVAIFYAIVLIIGCVTIYSSLFSIGSFIYGKTMYGIILLAVAITGTYILFKMVGKLRVD